MAILNAWRVGLVRFFFAIAAFGALVGCSGSTCNPLASPTPTLVSLSVGPPYATLPAGYPQQYVVSAIYSDGSKQQLPASELAWFSSNATAAAMSTLIPGTANTLSPGETTISATLDGISASTTLHVTAAVLVSIEVTATGTSVPAGISQPFQATGIYSDGSHHDLTSAVTWTSSASGIAGVSNGAGSNGVVTAAATGSTVISATLSGVSGSAPLTVTPAVLVSIAVTPASASLPKGLTQQYTATATFSDGSHEDVTSSVTWSSNASGTASIAAGGLASASSVGAATITAALGSVSGSAPVTVTAPTLISIGLTPANGSVPSGRQQQVTAVGVFSDGTTQPLTTQAVWTSSNPAVAPISNAGAYSGLATALSTGTTTLTATYEGISGSTGLTVTAAVLQSIAVTPASPSIADGTSEQFTATGTYSDNSTQNLTTAVTWSSSATGVATVSNAAGTQGLAASSSTGNTTITATSQGVSGSTGLTVTAAVLQSIEVTPSHPSIADGTSEAFTATGIYSDGTTHDITAAVTWTSSAQSIATVSNATGSQGVAGGSAVGTTTITATLNGLSGSTPLNVTPATLVSIAVTPAGSSIASGTTQQFTATGTYSDNSTHDLTTAVTWSSSATGIATVSNASGSNGLASSAGTGNSTITATYQGVSGSTGLTVTAAVLQSIAVTPSTASVAKGDPQAFTATGTYSDGSHQNLTTTATWTSTATTVATISNAAGTQGVASTLTVGGTTITATQNGISGAASLNVSAAVLVSIAVTPANPTVFVGAAEPFVATGTYSDGSTENITASPSLVWTSSSPSVATESNATGTQGQLTPLTTGSVSVTATENGISGSTGTVTVALPEYAYVANHGDNTISTFLIGNSGSLTKVGSTDVSSYGSQPFAIAIDQNTGNSNILGYMYVTNIAASNGLAQFSIATNGALTETATYNANLGNPDYLTLYTSGSNTFLYVADLGTDAINEYQVGNAGALTLNGAVAGGPTQRFYSPYDLVIHPTQPWMYVLGSVSGNVVQYSIDPTTGLLSYQSSIQIPGAGPTAMIPELITIDASGTHAYVSAQYGSDSTPSGTVGEVMEYTIDQTSGNLTLVNTVSAGVYARSIIVDPTGKYVYVANVYGDSISEYSADPVNGLTLLTTISTGANSNPSALNMDPTGQYVYASLQGSNTILEYSFNSDGTLNFLNSTSTGNGPDWVATGN